MSLQKENYKRDILTTNTKKKQSTIHINSLKIKKKKKKQSTIHINSLKIKKKKKEHNILHWIVIKADELQMSSSHKLTEDKKTQHITLDCYQSR
jgi:hypothetical protein